MGDCQSSTNELKMVEGECQSYVPHSMGQYRKGHKSLISTSQVLLSSVFV